MRRTATNLFWVSLISVVASGCASRPNCPEVSDCPPCYLSIPAEAPAYQYPERLPVSPEECDAQNEGMFKELARCDLDVRRYRRAVDILNKGVR